MFFLQFFVFAFMIYLFSITYICVPEIYGVNIEQNIKYLL